jgi:hypothetical protein
MSALFDRQQITFFARRYRHARHVALRVLCAVPRVALRAPCAVPDVVRRARSAVPDVAPYQTSASQWTAWRAWCWSGLQQGTPSELRARPQVQTQPRIRKEKERFDARPASIPNVHPCQAPGLLPSSTPHKFQRAGIDLNQSGRCQQIHIAHDDRSAGNGDLLPDLHVRRSIQRRATLSPRRRLIAVRR